MPIILGPNSFGRRRFRTAVTIGALIVDLWVWGGDTTTITGGHVPALLIVAVACVAYSCLAIWSSALPGYVALLLLSCIGLLVPSINSFAGYLLALFLMARTMRRTPALLALLGSVVPVTVNTWVTSQLHSNPDVAFLLTNAGLWTLLILAIWAFGRIIAYSDRRLRTERKWAKDARSDAIAVERLRISRDIHDIVAHSLTGIILQAAGARNGLAHNTASRQELDRALETIQTAGEQSMRELHRLLGLLRDADDTNARPSGIEQVVSLIQAAQMSGFDVTSRVSGDPTELDPSIGHTVYRVVQEGLSNAMKHGGAGAHIEVRCDWLPESLAVSVRNTTGIEAAPPLSGGFGLIGLRERISVCAGTLEAGPTTNGFLLHATVPTNPGQSPEEQR